METTKLTLSIPKKVLVDAKAFSKKTRQPLSRLVARYFEILARGTQDDVPSPMIKQITGLAHSNEDDKKLLWNSLQKKYR